MAESFVGLTVQVILNEGTHLEGVVSHIDRHTSLLTLKNVTLTANGHSAQHSIFAVPGNNIKDITVLPLPTQQFAQPTPYNVYSVDPTRSSSGPMPAANGSSLGTAPLPPSVQTSTLLPRSPLSDPAIISFSQAPSSSTNNAYAEPRSTSYDASQLTATQEQIPLLEPEMVDGSIESRNARTTDSDWKADDDDYHGSPDGFTNNMKQASNGQVHGAEASGIESDGIAHTARNHRRGPRRKKTTNGSLQNPGSPAKRQGRRRRNQNHEWAGEDVNDFKLEEFDFQGNLDLFDKEKIFAEIRELDSTAPENLLVNINRNTNYPSQNQRDCGGERAEQKKLASNENVLEMSLSKTNFYHTDEEDEAANDGEVDSDDSWNKKSNGGSSRSVKLKTVTGLACQTIEPVQMVEVERIAALEAGPNEDQMIENAGRSTATMCLRALGGARRIQPSNHNAAPLVVVLSGNNKTGAYGLATARHLANHGCHVVVCVVGKEKDLLKSVAYQQKILLPTGGKVVESVAELPPQYTNPVDLIIDALLGYQFTLRNLVDEHCKMLVCDLIEWANVNKAPVLSLDMPSGVNGSTGIPGNAAHYIQPKWTLCLGAPKTGCKSRSVTGELFLADIGIPRVCWKRIGVKGWGMPWGSDYLVGLEYTST